MKQQLSFNQKERLWSEINFKHKEQVEIKSATYDTDTNEIEFEYGLIKGEFGITVECFIPLSDETIDYILNGISLTRE